MAWDRIRQLRWVSGLCLALLAASAESRAGPDASAIAGRVLDEIGRPVTGARVTAYAMPGPGEHTASSDGNGAYRIAGLVPGRYRVASELIGFGVAVSPVVVEAGETINLDFTLRLLSLDELLQIPVRSASRIPECIGQAPGSVTVVTREQATDYGWVSLNDILYRQAGFGPAQDYDRRTVSSRGQFEGWNNNHLLHLVDGIPMNDNLYGSAYTWEITPLFVAKNVEVLRGPSSALYGSYATNGAVQVNTLSAAELDGRGEGRVRIGDAGVRAFDWVQGVGAEGAVAGVLGYSSYETDGNEYPSFDGSGRRDDSGQLRRFLTNDRRDNHYFWAKLEAGDRLEGLTLQLHEQAWRYQTGHGWLWWIPDSRESMAESRRIAALAYRPRKAGRLAQDHLVRYQRHDIDWRTRYYPNGALGRYPAGMWESLTTSAYDVLGRVQMAYDLDAANNLLVGFEADRFSYAGDREHNSNVDVDDAAAGFPPFFENQTTPLGPWLDYLLDLPVTSWAAYGQLSSRGLLDGRVHATFGARYDRTFLRYHEIAAAARPRARRTFARLSPRAGLVFSPSEAVSLKLLAGQAFRSPTLTELGGAHTFSLYSNIQRLRPEVVTTTEAVADWRISRYLSVRGNVFYTRFANQIAYSVANYNLSTNVYTLETGGAEGELLLTRGALSGFLNYSYAKRLAEAIIDETITASPHALTWEPAHKLNFGAVYGRDFWKLAATGHYQGRVRRRPSEVGAQVLPLNVVALDLDRFRPRAVEAWLSLDARASLRLSRNLSAAIAARNLLDADHQALVKVLAFPFDYRQEGRRLDVSLSVEY